MHDGSLKTLEEVVDFYDKGGIPNKNLDANIKKLHLTDAEKKDLVDFLKALSGEGWQQVRPPANFPQ
jgi:cytochrome c peroxidase